MQTKQALTQELLELLPVDQRPNLQSALTNWWMNFRQGGGLRLTSSGYQALVQCQLSQHSFDLPVELQRTAKFLLALDRKLNCPYYIEPGRKPKITLFGQQQAVMLALYGDIEKWMTLFLLRQ